MVEAFPRDRAPRSSRGAGGWHWRGLRCECDRSRVPHRPLDRRPGSEVGPSSPANRGTRTGGGQCSRRGGSFAARRSSSVASPEVRNICGFQCRSRTRRSARFWSSTVEGNARQWQVERRREDLVGGRLDAEVVANDGVGDFVVLPAADAVNEEIAEADTGEERERQGAGAERLNVAGGGRSPLLAVVGVDPEWRFTLRQFGSGVVVAANAIGFSVRADGGVVDGAEARQIVEYLPGEMSKCPGPRQSTDGEIEIAATPPCARIGIGSR